MGVAVADKCGARVADISCPIRVIQVYFYFNVSQPSVYFDNLLSGQAGLTQLSSPSASTTTIIPSADLPAPFRWKASGPQSPSHHVLPTKVREI